MKRITKAQTKKRLMEARQKLFIVYGFSTDLSDGDATKLIKMRSELNKMVKKLK